MTFSSKDLMLNLYQNAKWSYAFGVILALALLITGWKSYSEYSNDLSSKTSSQVSSILFHVSVPRGTTITASGDVIPGDAWVIYRAQNIGLVIAAIRKSKSIIVDGPITKFDDERPSPWGNVNPTDVSLNANARKIGWARAFYVKSPIYYEFSQKSGYSGWVGEIVVDRANESAYIRAYQE